MKLIVVEDDNENVDGVDEKSVDDVNVDEFKAGVVETLKCDNKIE